MSVKQNFDSKSYDKSWKKIFFFSVRVYGTDEAPDFAVFANTAQTAVSFSAFVFTTLIFTNQLPTLPMWVIALK